MKYHKIRQEIKKFASEQIKLKPQRKTHYFTGNRTVSANEACWKVLSNRYHLMHLYMAYAIIKGREPVYPKKKEHNMSLVNKLVDTFSERKVA